MRYHAIAIQLGTAFLYCVQDTSVDVNAIVTIGGPYGTLAEAQDAAAALNGA